MVNHGSTMGKNGNIAGFSIDIYTGRRQFGSQTYDKMDRWKSRDDSSQRRERVRREEVRRERVSSTSRKKIKVREKVAKSRNTLFFQCFVAPEGRKVGSVKRWVRSHLSQNAKSTSVSEHFWKFRCRKRARRSGAKHISNRNGKSTTCSEHFWKLRCCKSARRCGTKRICKSTCIKRFSSLW